MQSSRVGVAPRENALGTSAYQPARPSPGQRRPGIRTPGVPNNRARPCRTTASCRVCDGRCTYRFPRATRGPIYRNRDFRSPGEEKRRTSSTARYSSLWERVRAIVRAGRTHRIVPLLLPARLTRKVRHPGKATTCEDVYYLLLLYHSLAFLLVPLVLKP